MIHAALLVLLQAAPAPAPVPTPVAAKPKPKLICRTTASTNSRLGANRVCLSKEQWAQRDHEIQSDMLQRESMRRSPVTE